MALMNAHDMPLQFRRSWTGLAAVGSRFWAIGAALIAVYFALNLLTEWHEFDRLGITLWSPDDGLSLALLLENLAFAPFFFFAAVLGGSSGRRVDCRGSSQHRRDRAGGALFDHSLCRSCRRSEEYAEIRHQAV